MKKYNVLFNAISYIMGSFFIQGLRFITLPFFSRVMSADDYALLSSYEAWISIITILIGVQAASTINNAYLDFGEDKIKKYMADIAAIGLLTAVAITICTLCGISIFTQIFELDVVYLLLGIVQGLFSYYLSILIASYRILNRVAKYLSFSIIHSAASVGVGILLVWLMPNDKYVGRIYASVFAAIVIGGISCIIIYKDGKHFWDKRNITYAMHFSIPLIFHSFGGIILGKADQLMLLKIAGRTTMGVYSYGTNFAHIIYVFGHACNLAYSPFYYSMKHENRTDEIVLINKKYIITYCLGISAIILLLPEIIKVMSGVQYYDAVYSAPLLAVAFMVNFLYTFPVNYEFYCKKTKYIALATTISAMLNVGLNLVFLPLMGSVGAAVATLLSTLFQFAIHYYVARKIIGSYEMPIHIFLIALAWIGALTVLYYIFLKLPVIRILMAMNLLVMCLIFMSKNKYLLGGRLDAD